jgi:general nucleoside transport system permease protein
MASSPLNVSIFLALACCVFVWAFLWHTPWGFELRAVGHNIQVAAYAGIKLRRVTILAMCLSGALAGLVGVNEIAGVHHRIILNFPAGYCFGGIAVALMGRNHPVGVMLASLLFGALYQGGAELAFEIPAITKESLMDDWFVFIALILSATLRVATPLILCALGALFCERSGLIDIGLEGKMLAAALISAATASVIGSAVTGLIAGILIAQLLALLHGFACITHRGNQVVSGVAINMLAAGLTIVFGIAWFKQGGQTPSLPPEARFMPIEWPGASALCNVPIVGPLYANLVSGHNLIVYSTLLAVPLVQWIVKSTRFGLRLRAVGEALLAVDAAGISVNWLRYCAVLICGLMTGIAGTYLSIAQNAAFSRDMTAGQGFIALAALIFGKWKPLPVFGSCLIFGLFDAVAVRLQGVHVAGLGEIPVQFIQVLPYVLTVVLLACFIGSAVAPKAIGVPMKRSMRRAGPLRLPNLARLGPGGAGPTLQSLARSGPKLSTGNSTLSPPHSHQLPQVRNIVQVGGFRYCGISV